MTARPTVVFDFDGTLALGRGPLQAYITALGSQPGGDRAVEASFAALAEFETGTSAHRDAYDAVRTAALAQGMRDADLGRAYLASRDLLGTDAAPVVAPKGLGDFLRELSAEATCVLATNAPPVGVERALISLGIEDSISDRHHDVGKPAGLAPIITAHLRNGPVLAVGDIWEFDLAPAALLGADTALVGVRETADARPTLRGAALSDLYDPIRDWAATPRTPHAPLTA
ncbi:HAD family hydrolase [Brachybacterium sp. FME24]|uniref:HAD family hydrolase n=1 Tax=Brachybacterium sp. FME24 TaxID=2742605 RepID=UPI001868F92D|nr:haloacid dehalogenase-like hydrolase [Brachybacterium sp. FME24]